MWSYTHRQMGLKAEVVVTLAFFLTFKKMNMRNSPKKIIVVGGGFAGMNFVKALANDDNFDITLVDRDNYHSFSPLLFQVGMAFIEPSNISYLLEDYFRANGTFDFISEISRALMLTRKRLTRQQAA